MIDIVVDGLVFNNDDIRSVDDVDDLDILNGLSNAANTSVKDGRVVAEVASGVRTNLDLDPAGEAHECVAACGTCSETDESFHA